MRAVKVLSCVAAVLAVSACFVTEEPLLPEGEGIALSAAPVVFCDSEDSCEPAEFVGDAYVVAPPPDADEAPAHLRFARLPLQLAAPVYLGEVELVDDDGSSVWFHMVARALPDAADGTNRFQIVQPDCTQASPEQMSAYGIVKLDNYTCSIWSWQDLSAYLIEAHAEDFNDPEWWADNF